MGTEIGPSFLVEDVPVKLVVPQDRERLALVVVVGTGKRYACRPAGLGRGRDFLDQPVP